MKKLFNIIMSAILFAAILLSCAACGGSELDTPQDLHVDEELTLSWTAVPNARSYRVEISPKGGRPEENTSQRTSYNLSGLTEGDYTIRLRAVGGKANDVLSNWSEAFDFHRDKDSGLLYRLINGNTEYEVRSAGSASGDVVIESEYRGKPVTGIGATAFRGSSKITGVEIPDTVTYIGESAFYNCSNLVSVTIPETVASIGRSAFQQCSKLEKINIPEAVTVIESSTFAFCRALGGIELGDNIVSIGESAFTSCTGLTEFTIPDSVQTIGNNAFRQSDGLTTVRIGSGLASVGKYAFAYCTSLASVEFNPLENEIIFPTYLFAYDTALERIEIPEGVTGIDSWCFYGDSALTEVTIPESVTEIAIYAFHNSKLTNDQLAQENGDGLVYVGDWLVDATEELKKTTNAIVGSEADLASLRESGTGTVLRKGTVGIANYAFCYTWPVEAKDENGETIVDKNGEPVMVDEEVSCENVVQIVLPNTVKYIGMAAFYHAPKLYSFRADNDPNLISIGSYAFANSTALASVVFTEGLKTIGKRVFSGCTNFGEQSSRENFIPDSVTRIGESAFSGTRLANQENTNGLIYAGKWLVGYLPSSSQVLEIKEGTVGIADYALYANQTVYNITGLAGVTKIGKGAFAYCSELDVVRLGANVRTIEDFTFYMCRGLTSITFPALLDSIGYAAFYRCESLGEVDLSVARVASIEDFAFDKCLSMTSLDLGSKLESIGEYAFYGCRRLRTVEIPDTVTELGVRAFGDCLSLDTVLLGSGLTEIEDYTFSGCVWLREVNIPSNIKAIGNYAFYHCERLHHLTIAEGVESIGDYAFYGNKMLTHAEIPASVKSIGLLAFKGCTALEAVTFKGEPAFIDENAFYGCSRLTVYGAGGGVGEDWSPLWDSSQRPAVWNVTLSEEGYVESLTVGENTYPHAHFGYSGPGREGYRFMGWAAEKGGEAVYQAADLETLPQGVTVYSVWEKTPAEDLEAWTNEYIQWFLDLLAKEHEEAGGFDESWTDEQKEQFLKDLFEQLMGSISGGND